jgi:hypothetical protein
MRTSDEEMNFIVILGTAMKAGNEAGDTWDLSNWYPCGAAKVLVKPRNSKFANWLIENEYGHNSDSMAAIIIPAPQKYGQSMEAQTLWASAVAKVLRETFNIKASVWSYID